MRILIIGAAATALALSACQRPAEETANTSMTDEAAMDAAPADNDPGGSAAMSGSGGDSQARAAGDASADTAGTAPATGDEMTAGGGASGSPVSQETRDGAKEKAEATNLHPRT